MLSFHLIPLTIKTIISLMVIYATIPTVLSQYLFRAQKNNPNSLAELNQQQIVLSVPKINLESFGIESKNSKASKKQIASLEDESKTYKKQSKPTDNADDWNADYRRREQEMNRLRNALHELEWEYFDRNRPNRPKSLDRTSTTIQASTNEKSIATSTTTTTTSRPRIAAKTRRPPLPPYLPPTARPSTAKKNPTEEYPVRDCQQECVAQHFLQHYKLKKCRPVFSRDCNCAKHFICPSINSTLKEKASEEQEQNYCLLNDDQRYPIGHIIPVPNKPCSVCRCIRDYSVLDRVAGKIDCSKVVDCPELTFGVKPSRSECYFAYSHDRCCGVEICPDQLKWDDERQRKCRYQNRTYRYGEQIELLENRCKRCICNEHWNEYDPESSPKSCADQMCFDNRKYYQNCLPIYESNFCCPVDYLCQSNFTSIATKESGIYRKYVKLAEEESSTDHKYHCLLNNRRYPLGQIIHISKDSTLYQKACAVCQCKIPPLMTCETDRKCTNG